MNNIMMKIIEDIDNLYDESIIKSRFNSMSIEQLNYFKENINNIKKNKLYKSSIHGIYHSEKVFLFAYLISLDLNLDEVDMQIITDASIYHDIGRTSDFEDSFHGLVSANRIETIIDSPIYKDENNLKILKAIIEYHSIKDNHIISNFDNYEIEDNQYERYKKLAKILKDADALDRKRFAEKCNAALDPKYLRYDISKELIEFAEEINKTYYSYLEKQNLNINELKFINSECLHGIGFDYFRISSVLYNGILSYKKMNDYGLNFPKNFDGGNGNRWISVVPAFMSDRKEEAYDTFIKTGISFYCSTQKLYKPMEYNRKYEAIEKGLPYDKSGYEDEMYAFLEIPVDDIMNIFIYKEYANKDIKDIEYLYNSLDFNTIKNKVAYIFKNIGYNSFEDNIDLCILLGKYKKELDKYMNLSVDEKIRLEYKMPSILNPILIEINNIVANLIHDYYAEKLGKNKKEKVETIEAVNYELSKVGIKANIVDNNEKIVYVIEHKKRDSKSK